MRADLAVVGIGTPSHGSSAAILDSLNLSESDMQAFWDARPVADIAADTVATTEDTAIVFNVLSGVGGGNADNFEGTPSITAFSPASNGAVSINAAGNVTYTPNANFNGTDTFTYTVTSGGVTETTTVTVNVAVYVPLD